jgi:hypothetical protein
VLPDQHKQLEQQDWSAELRYREEPTSEQHPKPLLHHLFLLFFLRIARTERRDAGTALSLSWSKTFQVPGHARETNQTSTQPQSACGSLTTDQHHL